MLGDGDGDGKLIGGMPNEPGCNGGAETEAGKEKVLGVEAGLGSISKLVANAPALGGVSSAESVDEPSADKTFGMGSSKSRVGSRSDAFMLSDLDMPLPTWLP